MLKWLETGANTDYSQTLHVCHLTMLSCIGQDVQPNNDLTKSQNLEHSLDGYNLYDVMMRCNRLHEQCHCVHVLEKQLKIIQQLKTLVIFLSSINVEVELHG